MRKLALICAEKKTFIAIKYFFRCRTSLLFQACLTSTKTNRKAVYICKELKFVPKQFHNMPKNDDKSCDLINFK